MLRIKRERLAAALMTATLLGSTCGAATAAVHVEGQAQAAGGPLANATVSLWAGSSNEPRQLAQTKTGADGNFQLNSQENIGPDIILYLTAQGGAAAVSKSGDDNPAIAWLSVLGNTPPAKSVINEMTTVASVWTNAQFLNGAALKGHPLGLQIAAGNVQSFVDLQTGGWGTTIQDSLNSGQTPTMANFATLADLLSGLCHARDSRMRAVNFRRRDGPQGNAPKDTLAAARSSRAIPGNSQSGSSLCSMSFTPFPQAKRCARCHSCRIELPTQRWVLPLKFDGGGYRAGGKAMFDSEGNLMGWRQLHRRLAGPWTALWQGNATKFNPNGTPLSPDNHGLCRRRHAGRHLRCCHRYQRQCLAHQLRRQVDCGVRQDRQATDAT